MANVIRYKTSQPTKRGLRKGNTVVGIGEENYGPTSTTGYVNGITPPDGGYVIYTLSSNNDPAIYVANNDDDLPAIARTLGGGELTPLEAKNYIDSLSHSWILDSVPNNTITDGLIFDLNARDPSSFLDNEPTLNYTAHQTAVSQSNYTQYSATSAGTWEAKHPNAIRAYNIDGGEITGYVNTGVTDWTNTYHAIWEYDPILNKPVVVMDCTDSNWKAKSFNPNTGQWASQGWGVGTKYVISWDQWTTHLDKSVHVGLYTKNSSNSQNFWDGLSNNSTTSRNTQTQTWQRVYHVYTVTSNWDQTIDYQRIYMYGHYFRNGAGVKIKIANVQLEIDRDYPSSFVKPVAGANGRSTRSQNLLWKDLSGNNYHASSSSDTSYVEYDSNINCFNFKGGEVDGHGLFIQDLNYVTGNSDQLEELTIDTLIKTTSGTSGNSNDQRIILSFDRSSVFRFSVGGDSGAAVSNPGKLSFMSPQTGDKSATNCPDLRDDKWHRVAVTFKSGAGNGLRYYVDGELVETDTSTYSPIGSQVTGETPRYGVIGAGSEKINDTPGSSTAPESIFDGSMASIKYYNKQLSQSDIQQNYYGGPIVTDSLQLCVDAANLVSYESGSTTTYDMVKGDEGDGYGSYDLNGTLYNGVLFNTMDGGTWDFDGTDDYIGFGTQAFQYQYDDAFSLEVWCNPDALSGFKHLIGVTYASYRLAHSSGTITFRLDANTITTAGATLTVGEWSHVIATWDPTTQTARVYKNGELVTSVTNTNCNWTSQGTDFRIASSPGENYYFDGKIPIGRVYNKTLSDLEALQNYNAQKARFGL